MYKNPGCPRSPLQDVRAFQQAQPLATRQSRPHGGSSWSNVRKTSHLVPSHLGTRESMKPLRAKSERLPRRRWPQVLADYFPSSLHNNPQKLSLKSPRRLLFTPLFSRKRLEEAKTSRNSFARNILQGTSLFSIFCSATLPVTSRKQGICLQNMGGGTPEDALHELDEMASCSWQLEALLQ